MARTQTMVQLSDELLQVLDRSAASRGASRSALIRKLLWQALEEDRERQIGETIAEGYRRTPQGVPDEWGDLSEAAEHANRETMRSLAAEERAAGFDPW
ncbi:MAG: ribbon-helix-helix protein, CopG family [Thermoleophilaceae bacterium]